jgi:hypothetical protein
MKEQLESITSDLNWCFLTIKQYEKEIEEGRLKRHNWLDDDKKHVPDHPMIADNRFKRMNAADTILKNAKTSPAEFSPDIMGLIYKHMFDCCAAVRLALTQALLYVGNQGSLPYLQELIESEKESPAVKNTSVLVFDKIKDCKDFLEVNEFLYVGDIKNGAAHGQGKMFYRHNAHLIYEGGFKDNSFNGEGVYYNDDGSVKKRGAFRNGELVG